MRVGTLEPFRARYPAESPVERSERQVAGLSRYFEQQTVRPRRRARLRSMLVRQAQFTNFAANKASLVSRQSVARPIPPLSAHNH